MIEYKCYLCSVIFRKRRKKIRSDKVFCSQKCANTYLASTRKRTVRCNFCYSVIKGKKGKYRKFCNNRCQGNRARHLTWQGINDKNSTHKYDRKAVRLALLEMLGRVCNSCNNSRWMDEEIPLEVEHVDGNSENNYISNLKLLCPNCHALTPTYKIKNRGNGRHKRLERYKAGKSY